MRLAKAEDAIIMPAFLARVPMSLPLDTALPVQSARGMPLLEAIEQRATSTLACLLTRASDAVADPAMRCATARAGAFRPHHRLRRRRSWVGLSYEDLRWMLDRVPAEILILRPAPEDNRRISTEALTGHF